MRLSNILDPIHAELDPLVWDNPASDKPVLKPVHAHWIKTQVYKTLEDAGYTDVEKWLSLVFTGSLTTYQYSANSDVDISLFVDTKVFPEWSRAEMIALMVQKLDGRTLPGTPYPLQDFVVGEGIKPSDLYKPGLRSGYNLDNGKWIVPPDRAHAHDVKAQEGGFYAWALQMADKMERLLRYEPDQAIAFWHSIHKKRQRDMSKGKGDFCLAPDTLVLTSRFEWKPIGEISVGDELVGFDEEIKTQSTDGSTRGQQRTFQRARVTSLDRKVLPSYRIHTDKQLPIVASNHHSWLVRGPKNTVVWKETQDLIAGDRIIRFGRPWTSQIDREKAAYVAGMFDGEGHITKLGRLQFAQKGGAVLEYTCECLDALGFGYSRHKKNEPYGIYDTAYNVQIFGGVAEAMRFLYQVPTVRLRQNYPDFWVGRQISPKGRYLEEDVCIATIERMEELRAQEVVAIGTSTKTLIAEGLYSHNSESNIVYKMLANRGLFPALSEASGEYIASVKRAGRDWFAPSYMIPDQAKQQIHEWTQAQQWPEGTKFQDPSKYHVTGIYSPEGFSNPEHQQWANSRSGITYPVTTTGIESFSPAEGKSLTPTVLRVHNPDLINDGEGMLNEAEQRGLPVSRFPGGYKPHITVAHTPEQVQLEHPGLQFPVGPLRDLHGYYDELKQRSASAPTDPPNLRQHEKPKERCSTCKMYWKAKDGKGNCWGYGEKDVSAGQVCDSWTAEKTAKTAAPFDRQLAKFVYDPATNRLLMGQMGRPEGEQLTHNQLLEHPMWGDWSDRNRAEMAFGSVAQNGYGSILSRTRLAPGKDSTNPYQKQYQTERALQRAIPGVRFTNPTPMLKPEWELLDDPTITYIGEPPAIEPAEEDKRWDFQSKTDPTQVAQRIYEKAIEGVGSTINLHGESPHTRYGFAPDLATQTPFPLESFSPADVESFIQRFADRLRDPEKFVGAWLQGDQVILDVTEGHDDFDTAYQRAWDGHQQSLWDGEIDDEIPVRGLDYVQPIV
jgi:hypothetical protein